MNTVHVLVVPTDNLPHTQHFTDLAELLKHNDCDTVKQFEEQQNDEHTAVIVIDESTDIDALRNDFKDHSRAGFIMPLLDRLAK